jgi:hypothetical protein
MRSILLAAVFILSGTAQAAVVYTYTGNTYNIVGNNNYYEPSEPTPDPYDISMRVTGTLVMPEEFVYGYNHPAEGDVLSFSFSDGVNTLTNENSTLTFRNEFIVDTDGSFLSWGIEIVRYELAGNGSVQIRQSIRTFDYPDTFDSVQNFECKLFDGYACSAPYERVAQIESSSGTWIKSSVVPVPAAVWLFGSALAGLGWMRRKQVV